MLERFYQFITRLIIKKCYEMCNIFNMDKILVWFDMADNFFINQTSEKTVHIHRIDNENTGLLLFLLVLLVGILKYLN